MGVNDSRQLPWDVIYFPVLMTGHRNSEAAMTEVVQPSGCLLHAVRASPCIQIPM